MRTLTPRPSNSSPERRLPTRALDSAPRNTFGTFLAGALALAFLASQALGGGTRLLFAFPAYAILALVGMIALLRLRGHHSRPHRQALFSAGLFASYLLARAFFSPTSWLAQLDIYSVLAGLDAYLITALVVTDGRKRMTVVALLLAGAVIQVVIGAIQFTNGDNWMPFPFLYRFGASFRASGFYASPNHLAGLLEIVGAFGLGLTFFSRWPVWAKLLAGYASVVCYIGVILSGSRGGYLSVLFSLLVFALLSLRLIRAAGPTFQFRLTIAAFALLVVAILGACLIIQKSDYLSERASRVAEKDVRLDYWRAALQQFRLAPVFGTGSRTYLYYGRLFRSPTVQLDPVYVHNDYLQLLAEYGAAGGVLLVLLLAPHLRWGLISARRLGPRRIASSHIILSNNMALNLGALSALAACLVHSFFDFNLHVPANLLLVCFVFGILATNGVPEEQGESSRNWTLLPRFALAALSLLLAMQIGRLAPGQWHLERARIALRGQRLAECLSESSSGLQFEKHHPELFYYLGRTRFLSADRERDAAAQTSLYGQAFEAYEKAWRMDPMNVTYSFELAVTLDALGRFSEAESHFDDARKLDPLSVPIQVYYQDHLRRWSGDVNARRSVPPQPEPPA